MIIALIGNDGSGKTTTSKELAKVFKDTGFEVIYKHEYDYVFLKPLLKLTGNRKLEQSRREMLIEHKKSQKYLLWPMLVWLDTLLQYMFFKLFKRNSIVILDRFPFDHYISFGYLGYLTKFTTWLYLHFPKADATILLWVEPEIAYSRKKDTHAYAISFYQGQTVKYLELAEQLGLKKVNTNNNMHATISAIFDILQEKPRLAQAIRKRALQNKTYSEAILKRIQGKFSDPISHDIATRVNNFECTVGFLQKLVLELGIKEYAIFKDYANYDWVGNDLDVIISEEDFDRLHEYLISSGSQAMSQHVEWRKSKSHSKSIDLEPEGLLNIDIHTAIGWRGVDLLKFEDVEHQIAKKQKFGIEYSALSSNLDALVYAYSHIFEKGFLVHLEFQILRDCIAQLPSLGINYDSLDSYLSWVKSLDSNRNFPIFLPLSLINSAFNIEGGKRHKLKTARSALKILTMQFFWKLRFKATQKLPFGIPQYEKH